MGFGDVQAVTDPLGHVTAYHYDADRNLVSTTDAEGNTTGYVSTSTSSATLLPASDNRCAISNATSPPNE